MIPSSDQIASDSRPNSSRMRARQRERPGRVHAAAERREHAQPPVADLVAEALDDDRAVGRHHARGLLLLAQVGRRGSWPRARRGRSRRPAPRGPVHRAAGELADRAAQLRGAADAVAAPERHRAGHARRGRHDHAVARDLLDAPGGGAEQEGLARPRLVDHLLVQLAHAPAVGQVHAVEAAVGDRAGVRHRQLPRALAGADGVLHAVPHDSRPQLGELLGGVAAVEHVEHLVEQLAAELGVGVGAAHQLVQLAGTRHSSPPATSPRSAGPARRAGCAAPPSLDLAVAHALGDHRALEQVGAELGEDAALGHVAHVVAGAADALQPAR